MEIVLWLLYLCKVFSIFDDIGVWESLFLLVYCFGDDG